MESESAPLRVVLVAADRDDGDPRVRRAAQAMADDGWDVHLVVASASGRAEESRHGGYTVHKRPLPDLAPYPTLRRRAAALRFPLAFADPALTRSARLRVKAEWIELEALGGERGSGLLRVPGPARRAARKVQRAWLERRISQSKARERFLAPREGRLERAERRWWTLLLGDRAWRRLDLDATRFELALRPQVLALGPDLLHAHDAYALGVCARAASHLKRKGRNVKLVYDVHEFRPGPAARPPDRREVLTRYERRYLPFADGVVAASRPLAALTREVHRLEREPATVLDVPPAPDPRRRHPGDLRTACGLDASAPLAVYSGRVSPGRRVGELIEAVRLVPGLHLALMATRPGSRYAQSLGALAKRHGVADRVHFRGGVAAADLCRFLESADLGVHPLPADRETALPGTFFAYAQARLPVVVSDAAALAAEVRRLGNGEVYRSGDAAGLATAIREVLADKDRYRRAYRDPAVLAEYGWDRQKRRYTDLYQELIGPAPHPAAEEPLPRDELRARTGIGADVPVVAVLDAGDEWTRTAVRGLASLPEVRTVVVCADPRRPDALGDLEDAVAVVPAGPVAAFLATASAAVLPVPDGDALPPHLAEALTAGVPVLVPDTPAGSRLCERLRIGETARPGDPAAVAAAVKQLLAGSYPVRAARAGARLGSCTPWPPLDLGSAVRLGLGPVNSAGQLSELARSISWHLPETTVEVVTLAPRSVFRYPVDATFEAAQMRQPEFQRERLRRVVEDYTHLLLDWPGPVSGWQHGREVLGDLPYLRRAGVRAALLFHGSEIRDPDAHLARHEFSPFADAPPDVLAALKEKAPRNRQIAEESGLPLFATTLDLLDDVPSATWLPLTVDVDRFHCAAAVMERRRPVVLHAPSKRWTKGTDRILPILERLDAAGKIEFRLAEGLPAARMRDLVRDADLVVDQLAIGCYSTFAVEAMAAGKPAIAYLHEATAERMGERPPVVHATVPTLEETVVSLVEDRDRARGLGDESRRFARRMHDGRAAAEALRPFLESR